MRKTSTPTVADLFAYQKHKLDGLIGEPPEGGLALFPSLSKGTLKDTFITNTHTSGILVETLTKRYPDKTVFYSFKFPKRKKIDDPESKDSPLTDTEQTPEQINDSIESSLRRTRREISDIVECNDFDKFATFTFDPKKHPKCNDYQYAKAQIIRFFKSQQASHGSFRYLVVAERQENGNIHFHALLGSYTGRLFLTRKRGSGDRVRQCYKILPWEKKFGFADCEDIGNKEATGRYIGKYLTKDISSTLTGNGVEPTSIYPTGVIGKHTPIHSKGEKRYFSSKGLNKPTKTYNQNLQKVTNFSNYDLSKTNKYENDFVTITTLYKK